MAAMSAEMTCTGLFGFSIRNWTSKPHWIGRQGAIALALAALFEAEALGFILDRFTVAHRLAGEGAVHALEHKEEALAARVDNAGFLEHGQLFGGALDGLVGTFHHLFHHLAHVVGVFRGRGGGAADLARDGQDGAFDRRGHGVIGGLGCLLEGLGKIGGGDVLFAAQRTG